MRPRREFLSESWLDLVRETFEALAPQTLELLGTRSVMFAEVYTEASTPTGLDGWYVTIGQGRVVGCARGQAERPADLTSTCTLAAARQLATARVIDPTVTVRRELGPDLDVDTLLRLGPLFAGVHETMAEQTFVP